MRTMIARPVLLVTTSDIEPESRHDWPTDTPPVPARPRHTFARAIQAGWLEDEEARDNDLGPMPDETEQRHRLGSYLLHLVRETDARIPAERRAPRTVAEMRARITIQAGQPCSSCGGAGGRTETVQDGNTVRQTWHTCSACGGSGTR